MKKSTPFWRRKAFCLLVLFSLLFLHQGPALAGEKNILVIKSQDILIYRQALVGFTQVYKQRFKEFDLKGNPENIALLRGAGNEKDWDLIVAVGLLAAKVAKKVFPDTPLVFSMIFDPARFSLLGPKTTGIDLDLHPSLVLPRIKILFPDVRQVGLLYDPSKTKKTVEAARKIAASIGLTLIAEPVTSEKEIPQVFQELVEKVDLLWMLPDSTVVTPKSIGFLLITALRHKLPIVTFSKGLVAKGATAAISPDYEAIGADTARLVYQVFDGKKGLHIGRPQKTKLTINLKTADKMGIRLDPVSLQAADQVYE